MSEQKLLARVQELEAVVDSQATTIRERYKQYRTDMLAAEARVQELERLLREATGGAAQ